MRAGRKAAESTVDGGVGSWASPPPVLSTVDSRAGRHDGLLEGLMLATIVRPGPEREKG